jgi:hypothetical protein
MEVSLNDAGRVALGPAIGSGVDRIDGMMLEMDSTGMTLSVKHLIGLDGSVQVWSDELVRIENSQVRTIALRRFSPVRTAALGAAGVGSMFIMVASGLNPFGLGGEPGGGDDTTKESIIRRIRP